MIASLPFSRSCRWPTGSGMGKLVDGFIGARIRLRVAQSRCSFAKALQHALPTTRNASAYASRLRAEGEPEGTPGVQSARLFRDRCPGTPPPSRVPRSAPVQAAQTWCRLSSLAPGSVHRRWLRCLSDAGCLRISAFRQTRCSVRMIPGQIPGKTLHLRRPNCAAFLASTLTIPQGRIKGNSSTAQSAWPRNKSSMVCDHQRTAPNRSEVVKAYAAAVATTAATNKP